MPHLELGSDHSALHKAALIHNAKEAEDEEARGFGMEPVVSSKKKEAPEALEDLNKDPEFEKFLKDNNDAILAKVDSLGGIAKYVKALEEFSALTKKDESTLYRLKTSTREWAQKQLNESVPAHAKALLIPDYNISYKKSTDAWHRRLQSYIQAVKQFEIEEEAPPPPPKKVKKITISGVRHSYKEGNIDGANVLIIYKEDDEKLEHPLGYYKWDMEKKRPSGKLLPMP